MAAGQADWLRQNQGLQARNHHDDLCDFWLGVYKVGAA
jgi:hypothetical protein